MDTVITGGHLGIGAQIDGYLSTEQRMMAANPYVFIHDACDDGHHESRMFHGKHGLLLYLDI